MNDSPLVTEVARARDALRATVAVVLNYQTANATIEAVRSLERPPAAFDRIIVVDNASPDDSLVTLRSELAKVSVVASAVNNGFAAGCNLGIRAALDAGARRVFLLNADATVDTETVAVLEEALDVYPDAGVAGPLVVSAAGPDVIESAGVRYSRLTGRMRHIAHGVSPRQARLADVAEVDAVSGCAMLVRREVFEGAGLLAEEFFYGFEDLEFCLRARARGFVTLAASRAVVRHRGQASIGATSPRRLYFAVRNHLRVASGVGPQAWPLRLGRAVAVIGWTAAYAVSRSGAPIAPALSAIGRGVRDHWRGRYGSDRP